MQNSHSIGGRRASANDSTSGNFVSRGNNEVRERQPLGYLRNEDSAR